MNENKTRQTNTSFLPQLPPAAFRSSGKPFYTTIRIEHEAAAHSHTYLLPGLHLCGLGCHISCPPLHLFDGSLRRARAGASPLGLDDQHNRWIYPVLHLHCCHAATDGLSGKEYLQRPVWCTLFIWHQLTTHQNSATFHIFASFACFKLASASRLVHVAFFYQGAVAAACQAIGVGPEDPLSWVCTAALIRGCAVILQVRIYMFVTITLLRQRGAYLFLLCRNIICLHQHVLSGVTDPQSLCSDIQLC